MCSLNGSCPYQNSCFPMQWGNYGLFASFENSDFLIVKFVILVITGFTCFITVVWANLRILFEIPSHHVAFLRLNLLICLLMNSSLMDLNSNDEAL